MFFNRTNRLLTLLKLYYNPNEAIIYGDICTCVSIHTYIYPYPYIFYINIIKNFFGHLKNYSTMHYSFLSSSSRCSTPGLCLTPKPRENLSCVQLHIYFSNQYYTKFTEKGFSYNNTFLFCIHTPQQIPSYILK